MEIKLKRISNVIGLRICVVRKEEKMRAEEGELIGKRKITGYENEGKSMYLLFRTLCGVRACGIYELKIPITTKQSSSEEEENTYDDGGFVFIEPAAAGEEKLMLRKVQTFFDQYPTWFRRPAGETNVGTASCVRLSNESFLLVPNEYERYGPNDPDAPRVRSLKFNLLTNETLEIPNLPNHRKATPFAASVNNKVYVISYYNHTHTYTGDSTFESFDPETNLWQSLETPPFYELPHRWHLGGYAVFDNYIIFSVELNFRFYKDVPEDRPHGQAYFSYNTLSGQWKEVDIDSASYTQYRGWEGEAVVIGNAIYGVAYPAWTLVAFPCSVKDCGTLSLGPSIEVKGWKPYQWLYDDPSPCVAIGKIGDRLLCVITNIITLDEEGNQPVNISFYYVYKLGCCHLLGSPMYHIPKSEEFDALAILSSLALEPSGDDGNNNELHRDKRAREEYEVKDSEVEMTESNFAIDVPEVVV